MHQQTELGGKRINKLISVENKGVGLKMRLLVGLLRMLAG
jgi:hypothetical protein